jgi:hypothetical protein
MRLLLSEDLPLRTTRVLGDFAEDKVLAQVYGDMTSARFPLVRISDTEGLASDHPMEITEAFVDDERTDSWQRALRTDEKGNAYTVVEFAAPVPAGSTMSARGRGKRNPTTGALIENPAEIMEDVLRLAGRDELFPDLRAQTSAYRFAGRLGDVKQIRAWLDEIARSAAAVWTPSRATLYPVLAISGAVTELDQFSASEIEVTASLTDTADVLRLGFDFDYASGKPQRFIELTANPKRYGGIVAERTFEWLRLPPNAEAIGRRVLAWLAGDRRQVRFTTSRTDVRAGTWVRLADHPEWPTPHANPEVFVLEANITPKANVARVSGWALLDSPSILLTSHSIALPSTTEGGIDVTFRNGVATLQLKDNAGKPLAGARVSLDGGLAKITDSQGRVSFVTTRGRHELAVEAKGFISYTVEFVL